MEVVPVKKYKMPEYPDKQRVLGDPRILRNMPERWKNNACIGIALSNLLMLTVTGCQKEESLTLGSTAEAKVAPIFEHGQGRGAFGCDSVAPPSFLSEEEAFQVIQEEAKKYGITFSGDTQELKKVGIPQTKFSFDGKDAKPINTTKTGNLMLDGVDKSGKIGFEFISSSDYREWQAEGGIYSTVESYDFLSTAKVLGDGIKDSAGETSIGIFYDPIPPVTQEQMKETTGWQERQDKAKELSKSELRKQVVDFLKWLKGQGIV